MAASNDRRKRGASYADISEHNYEPNCSKTWTNIHNEPMNSDLKCTSFEATMDTQPLCDTQLKMGIDEFIQDAITIEQDTLVSQKMHCSHNPAFQSRLSTRCASRNTQSDSTNKSTSCTRFCGTLPKWCACNGRTSTRPSLATVSRTSL